MLLGRKVMTNLDSILKSRDMTLPTKVHLVKAMGFPVVMNGCENWPIKKLEEGDCTKLKSFHTAKETSSRVTGNLPNGRKCLQTTHAVRG